MKIVCDVAMNQRFIVLWCVAGENSVWFGHESEVYSSLVHGRWEFCIPALSLSGLLLAGGISCPEGRCLPVASRANEKCCCLPGQAGVLLIKGIVVVADAAYSLMQKKSLLFALNSNNALLQFVLEVNTWYSHECCGFIVLVSLSACMGESC